MIRPTWIRNAEIISILPATILLLPTAGFAALGMVFAIAQDSSTSWFTLDALLQMLKVLGLFLCGFIGIISLWLALILPSRIVISRTIPRLSIFVGVLIGVADALYWLWTMAHDRSVGRSLGSFGWAVWLTLLIGPLVVSIHQIMRLTRTVNRAGTKLSAAN